MRVICNTKEGMDLRLLIAVVFVLLIGGTGSSSAEVVQREGLRVSLQAGLKPGALPRQGSAPVAVAFSGSILLIQGQQLPQLRKLTIQINSHGAVRPAGTPRCPLSRIEPSSTSEALAACRSALVGEGRFSADVEVPEQSPFPASGRILAFNGRFRGAPAILAHIYGVAPYPTSFVLPFAIRRTTGTYGTSLEALLPRITDEWGFVTGISLTLGSTGSAGGNGFVTAGCPAPAGFPGVTFPLAKVSLYFAGGNDLSSVLDRSCKAR